MIKQCPQCSKEPHTQDVLHGKGNRVFNVIKHGENTKRECTVCGYSETRSSGRKK